MLNLDNLREIADGDETFIVEVLTVFLKKEAEYAGALKKAIKTQDMEMLRQITHKIKSSISVLGMDEFRQNLHYLEKGVENGSLEMSKTISLAEAALDEFYESLEAAKKVLATLAN